MVYLFINTCGHFFLCIFTDTSANRFTKTLTKAKDLDASSPIERKLGTEEIRSFVNTSTQAVSVVSDDNIDTEEIVLPNRSADEIVLPNQSADEIVLPNQSADEIVLRNQSTENGDQSTTVVSSQTPNKATCIDDSTASAHRGNDSVYQDERSVTADYDTTCTSRRKAIIHTHIDVNEVASNQSNANDNVATLLRKSKAEEEQDKVKVTSGPKSASVRRRKKTGKQTHSTSAGLASNSETENKSSSCTFVTGAETENKSSSCTFVNADGETTSSRAEDDPNIHANNSNADRGTTGGAARDQAAGDSTADTPVRSHMCRLCQKRILRRDHHCFFMTVCVGYHNHKHFIFFLFYYMIGALYCVIMCAK
jgi:palmitoyltransferase